MRRATRKAKRRGYSQKKNQSASAFTFFKPRFLTAHRKQSATRPCRTPALLGMLLCAARLLVIPEKIFSRGQGMNSQIGITCLRPFVGFLSTIVAAILLYGSNDADAQSQPAPMLGIFYLENADALGQPPYNWDTDQGLTNPYVQGIALRTHWNRVEPHEHANADDFYWDYLDQGVARAAANGKKVSISVQAGVETPQ